MLLAILALFASPFADAQGLVPCGTKDNPTPCSPCHIFVLVQNIYNFIIFKLAPPIAALMFVYGGFLMVVPGFGGEKSANALTKGKKVITNTLIGLAIVFFAWLGVDTIIKILVGRQEVGSGVTAEILKLGKGGISLGPWNKIECSAPSSTPKAEEQTTFLTPEKVGVAGAVLSKIAEELKKKVNFSSSADCRDTSGKPVSAQTTINEVAAGEQVTVCSSACTNKAVCKKSNIPVSGHLLAALDTLTKEFKFIVTSITTGDHQPFSCHYGGVCVDVVPTDKKDFEKIRSRLEELCKGGSVICEGKKGKYKTCTAAPASDPPEHVHAQCP